MRSCTRLRNAVFVACLALCVCVVPAFAVVQLDNTTPADAPIMGGYWVGGYSTELGEVTIYVSDNEGWTLNEYDQLFRYANNSASGYLYTAEGTQYQFSVSAFSVPRYRNSGSSYNYTDLHLSPTKGNIIIDDSFASPYDMQTMCSVFACFMLGVLVVLKLIKRG